jgi:hypothetical protein
MGPFALPARVPTLVAMVNVLRYGERRDWSRYLGSHSQSAPVRRSVARYSRLERNSANFGKRTRTFALG